MGWVENNTNKDPMAKVGMRVRMLSMDDKLPVDEGMEGTIHNIDDLGTLHVKWDDGRSLGVIPGIDNYQLLPSEDEQISPDEFESMFEEGKNDFKISPAAKKLSRTSKAVKKTKTNLKKLKKHGIKVESEEDLEETTTAGSAGAYNAPLFGKQTTIRKPKSKKLASNIITKGDLKNPLGKIYSFKPKTESKVIKFKDLVNEVSSTHASKLRAAEGTFDGDPWVGKKGWMRKDELAWEGGEISDILAKLDINWNDSDLTLTDMQTDKINEAKKILKEIYVDPTPVSVLLTMYIGSRLAGAKPKEVPQYIAELGGDL